MSDASRSRRFYGHDASTYDQARFSGPGYADSARTISRVRGALDELRIGYGDHALEVGCGTGRITAELLDYVGAVTLVDVSAEMINYALSRASERRGGAMRGACVADIGTLGFRDDTFDLAVSINVLSHVADLGGAIRELARVVRPGGSVLFSVSNRSSLFWPAAVVANRRGVAFGHDVPSAWHSMADVRSAVSSADLEVKLLTGAYYTPRAISPIPGVRSTLSAMQRMHERKSWPIRSVAPPWLLWLCVHHG